MSKTAIAIGTFDVLHEGHRYFLREVSKVADKLVVAVNRSSFNLRYKGEEPVQTLDERMSAIRDLSYVDEVITNIGDEDSKPAIRVSGATLVAHGDDWTHENGLMEQMGLTKEFMDKYGIEFYYVSLKLDDSGDRYSSTSLKQKIKDS